MDLQRITSRAHPLFDAAWQIYEASFPAAERRSFSDHLRALSDPAFYTCAAVDGGALCAIVFFWQTEDFLYLEHFAVDPAARGAGYGTKALQALIDASRVPLILEIEQPVDALTRRREHFYARLGLRLQPYPHGAFAYQAGTVCVPLRIMARPDITQAQYDAFYRFFAGHVLPYTACRP